MASHDVSQEEPTDRDLDALQPAGDSQSINQRDVPPPSTLSLSSELEPLSPTKPHTLKRKRKSVASTKSHKRKRKAKDSLRPDPLPANVIRRVQDVATFDDIVFLWVRLQVLSASTPDSGQRTTPGGSQPFWQTLSRRQRLERLWVCIGNNEKNERWATILKRICQAEFFGQYLEDRARFNQWKEQRKVQREHYRTTLNGIKEDASPLSHPLTEYVLS
jgi:hypothetical protein